MGKSRPSLDYCTVVRPSNYLDRMFYLYSRVGVQSNILISAHYTSSTFDGRKRLDKEAVYSAVRSVLEKYPELSIIGVPEPLPKKGHHSLLIAALHEIDLETCVEFLDDEPPSVSAEVIERLHNQWDWTDEQFNPRRPWWKVVVLGRQEVVFVFHHIVCDGRFGHTFHLEFLAGINEYDEEEKPCSRIVKIDPERVRLDKELEDFWTSTVSVLNVVHVFIMNLLLRLFLGGRLLFTGLPESKPYAKDGITEATPDECTKTRIVVNRIPAAKMQRILAACRERKATFTPLLIVMTLCALACDFYPKATVGIANCALDMRGIYPTEDESPDSGKLLQCAGGIRQISFLNKYRRLFPSKSRSNGETDKKTDEKIDTAADVDVDGAWELVRECRASIVQKLEAKPSQLLVVFRAANSMSNDLESMLSSTFPAFGLHLNNSVQVSNIGAFPTGDQGGHWKIDDTTFSAACVNGSLSYNLSLNVSGVQGGDTVIAACYEDGILEEDVVSGILEAALEKMEAII
ncbi:hypothetical protein AK830_g2723 [Neonectria ditissima]|uniref:Alcohol acetyltransferase FCK4 n=1 Tax=Neonectria ditissima TaxID=78410 RepID=A0A0P7B1R3_9HYPO|nr:hypothetical protein AK830_g2723 [Neonectria ditissima]